jgi:hypothetical protein
VKLAATGAIGLPLVPAIRRYPRTSTRADPGEPARVAAVYSPCGVFCARAAGPERDQRIARYPIWMSELSRLPRLRNGFGRFPPHVAAAESLNGFGSTRVSFHGFGSTPTDFHGFGATRKLFHGFGAAPTFGFTAGPTTFHGFGATVDFPGFGTDACATGTAAKANVRTTATKVNLFFTTPPSIE